MNKAKSGLEQETTSPTFKIQFNGKTLTIVSTPLLSHINFSTHRIKSTLLTQFLIHIPNF